MALENYQEMRERVLDPEYRRKKTEAEQFEMKDPNFIPRYSMVMFHPNISYATALSRASDKVPP
jgi:kynurenine 3-monooxygenase